MLPSPNTSFPASYDATTNWISAATFALFLVLTATIHSLVVGCLGALILSASYAWSPRSYAIADRSIIVRRLIGDATISLDGIRDLRIAAPGDFLGCVKLFGNGGLFGYYGLFRTSKLGKSVWYLTNRKHAVVLITDTATSVFSPDDRDGFLAAVRAAAPGPLIPPEEFIAGPLAVGGPSTGIPIVVGTVVTLAVAVVVAFAVLYSPGPPNYTLTGTSLTIHDRFYPVTLAAGSVDVAGVRLVDLGVDTDWRSTARTNGFANGHYRSGWFRVLGGKTVRLYQADGQRLVLLPPKGDGAAVLLETRDPEKFLREVHQAWSGGS